MFSTQIERIKRDINAIEFKIMRYEKKGNTKKVHDLREIRAYIIEQLEEIKEAYLY